MFVHLKFKFRWNNYLLFTLTNVCFQMDADSFDEDSSQFFGRNPTEKNGSAVIFLSVYWGCTNTLVQSVHYNHVRQTFTHVRLPSSWFGSPLLMFYYSPSFKDFALFPNYLRWGDLLHIVWLIKKKMFHSLDRMASNWCEKTPAVDYGTRWFLPCFFHLGSFCGGGQLARWAQGMYQLEVLKWTLALRMDCAVTKVIISLPYL